jgi:hypothetical protein
MDALSVILLLAGLALALGAPRIRWQRVRVHGPWWGYRALSRTGQVLLTIHGELLAGALIGWGISGLVPGDLGKVFTLVGGACLILNIVTLLLVTGPLMLVGVATERPPKA